MNFSFFLTCNVAEFKTELSYLNNDEFISLMEYLNKNLDYLTMEKTLPENQFERCNEIKRVGYN